MEKNTDKNGITQYGKVTPIGETNIITDNMTKDGGYVYNKHKTNASYARRWVDENHL